MKLEDGEMGVPAALGLETPDDLYGFEFQTIRRKIFDFYLQTIGLNKDLDGEGHEPNATELEIFSRTGVYGLEEYHRANQRLQEALFEALQQEGGLTEKPSLLGKKGYRLAYTELNAKVERALRALNKQWHREVI